MVRWNPWRVLRGRTHVDLEWHPAMRRMGGGISIRDGFKSTIVLDPGMDRAQRNAALGHELVHEELDFAWERGTPELLVSKGEQLVGRITVDRLVPPEDLRAFVHLRVEAGECVEVIDAAEEFDVPLWVAQVALERLRAA